MYFILKNYDFEANSKSVNKLLRFATGRIESSLYGIKMPVFG